MRYFAYMILLLFATACSSNSQSPVAKVDVTINSSRQPEVIEAIRAYGEKNSFKIGYRDTLPKQGRKVIQITLTREDGVVVSASNFMDENILQIFFYSYQKSGEWTKVKSDIVKSINSVIADKESIKESNIN